MGINLGGNVSQADKDRVKNIRNPSATDAGDDFGSSDGFDDMFDSDIFDDDSVGGDSSSSSFDDLFGSSNTQSNSGFPQATNNAFGDQSNIFNTPAFGGGLTGFNQQQQQPQKEDTFDKVINYSGTAFVSIGNILLELFKSTKSRTADDIGYYSTCLIKTGFIGLIASIVLCFVAAFTNVAFLGITGITRSFLLGFTLTAGFGLMGMGLSALSIASADKDSGSGIQELSDVSSEIADDHTDEYENDIGSIMDDLFGDSEDEISFDEDDSEDFNFDASESDNDTETNSVPNFGNSALPINFDNALNNVKENTICGRKTLIDTFINFLPLCTPDFSYRRQIDPSSDTFIEIETAALKALSNVLKCELEEVKSSLDSAYETYFSFEFRMLRVRGMTKTAEFASEIEIYFRQSSSDTSVNATVDIEGDFFKVIVTKGVTAIVTIGDAMKQQYVYDFFANEKNKLPMISGIDELGNVMLDDAKSFDTMLIAGKPRSGKSWYVLGILASLICFNSPEDVQFIIVDPKESNLFKTLALMPHVAGLHNDEHILEVLNDIIDNEAPRRKRLLADNRCDNIWDLRKKGVRVPILYLVIDEYITVRSNLKEKGMEKELDSKLQVLISQLPSQGIRLIFVPHRATGVVDKTNRTMLQFTASVKGSNDEVCDTLGIKNWKHELTNPGDVALKSSNMKDPLYVRGVAFGTSDEENSDLIESVAKAFYKMGVDLPDMSTLQVAANRDEDYIRDTLVGNNRVQFNVNELKKNGW